MKLAHRFIYGKERNKQVHKVPSGTNEKKMRCKKLVRDGAGKIHSSLRDSDVFSQIISQE